MYIYLNNVKPSRKTFILTVCMIFGVSALGIAEPETKDALSFAYCLLEGGVIYLIVGLLIIYGGKYRDDIFGFSLCPYCKKRGWSIKEN
jgi:hypothetical protein